MGQWLCALGILSHFPSKAVAGSKHYVSLGNAGPALVAVCLLGRYQSWRSLWYLWHKKTGRACADLLMHMITRDGAGLHNLFAMLLVTYLLHLSHGFAGNFLRPQQVWLLLHPEGKEPSFDLWLFIIGTESPGDAWKSGLAVTATRKEWGQQPVLSEEVIFYSPAVATVSHTPIPSRIRLHRPWGNGR